MKRWKKRLLTALLSAAIVLTLAGCGGNGDAPLRTAIPSATGAPEDTEGRLRIHMYGTLDESHVPFLNALAEQFPEVELQYEYQWDICGVHEFQRRILHEDGPDLAVVVGAALFSLTEQGLLLDLTGAEFSTRYHVSTMTKLNDQGQVLGLPLPNDLRCLICNRGILEENGITEMPKDISGLLQVCQTLTEQGQGAIIADEQLYQMLLRASYLSKPAGYDWLQAYNNGETVMAGTPAAEAWEDFESLAAVSGCVSEDATALPAARTAQMLAGNYAFRVVTLSNMKYMRDADPDLDMVALPLLGREDPWVFYADQKNMRYFVANGALAEPENAEKREIVLRMLDWISTQEAQQILATCGSSAISYVNNVELEQGAIMEYLDPVIEAGRLTSSELLGRGVLELLPSCAAQFLDGTMTADSAVKACDEQNAQYTPPEEAAVMEEVIGSGTAPIYWRKPAAVTVGSPMAQLAAIAMAEAFPDADFSFAMGKNTASTLYAGEITMDDVLVCSNGEGDRELVLVEATGKQIKDLIEGGVGSPTEATLTLPYGVVGKGRLIHPAGLTYRADITREAGDKVTEIVLADGGTLDMDQTYTVAVSGLLVDGVSQPNLEGCPVTSTGKHLRDVLADYIRTHSEVSPPEMGLKIDGATPLYTLP